jgi:hypothetical protein
LLLMREEVCLLLLLLVCLEDWPWLLLLTGHGGRWPLPDRGGGGRRCHISGFGAWATLVVDDGWSARDEEDGELGRAVACVHVSK